MSCFVDIQKWHPYLQVIYATTCPLSTSEAASATDKSMDWVWMFYTQQLSFKFYHKKSYPQGLWEK